MSAAGGGSGDGGEGSDVYVMVERTVERTVGEGGKVEGRRMGGVASWCAVSGVWFLCLLGFLGPPPSSAPVMWMVSSFWMP